MQQYISRDSTYTHRHTDIQLVRQTQQQQRVNITSADSRTLLTLMSPGGATGTTTRRLGDGRHTVRVL